MVLESIVVNLLNTYLGKYIENLDSNNLEIGIFKGNVELTNLKLKPEALFELNLPIEVKAGHVEKISLAIPWTSLYTLPLIVVVEGIHVLAGPVTDRPYDPVKEARLENAVKQKLLQQLDKPKKSSDISVEDEKKNMTFVEKLTASIINNIQVTLKNVHVRYEDTVTYPDNPIAFGVILQSLTAQTTDDLWQPTQVDASVSVMRKLIKMESLAAYWNSPSKTRIGTQINDSSWLQMMYEIVKYHKVGDEAVDFVIHPIMTEAKISFDKSDTNLMEPKIMLDIVTEEISTALSRQQYVEVLDLVQSFKMMDINKLYRKYEPDVPVKGNAKAWWQYAYKSILEEYIRPWSWERIKEHRYLYEQYKKVFKTKLENPDNVDHYARELRQLEDRLDVANILMAREHARIEFIKEAPEREKRRKKEDSGWSLWKWITGSSDSEDELEVDEPETQGILDKLTEKEKEELYKAIGYDEESIERAEDKPPDYVERRFTFTLQNCAVSLRNIGDIMKFSFHNMVTSFEQRPSADAFKVRTSTTSVLIQGCTATQELIPILTSEKTRTNGYGTQVFSLEFETNPLSVTADSSVSVNMEPVEVIYHDHTLSELINFLTIPQVDVEGLKAAASNTLQELAVVTRANLMSAIENHKTIHVDIDVKSPYIIIPEHGAIDKGGHVLILDLGSLTVTSDLQTSAPVLEDSTMTEIEQRLYDKFNIRISDIQILFAQADDDWHNAHALKDTEYHLLPSTALQISVFLSVKPDYKLLPQTKLEAVLPSLKVTVSDERLKALLKFAQNIPLPSQKVSTVSLASTTIQKMDVKHVKQDLDMQSLRRIRKSVSRKPKPKPVADEIDAGRPNLEAQPSVADSEPYYSASDHSDEEVQEWASILEVPAFEDTASNSNYTTMLLRFIIREVMFLLSKVEADKSPPVIEKAATSSAMDSDSEKEDNVDNEYLMFRVDSLCTDVAVSTYSNTIHIGLGGIQVIDKIHTKMDGTYLHLISSPTKMELISILYRKVDPKCPDFQSYYNAMEQAAVIRFTALNVVFHKDAMMHLKEFTEDLLKSASPLTAKESPTTESEPSIQIPQQPQKTPATGETKPDGAKQTSAPSDAKNIKFFVRAKLDYLSLTLCDTHNNLAEVFVRDLECAVTMKVSRTTIRARLKDLSIEDSMSSNLYTKIVCIEDATVFDVKFIIFNQQPNQVFATDIKTSPIPLDYNLRLRMGRVQFVFLNKFIIDVTKFFEPFTSKEAIASATEASSDFVQKQVEDIQRQGKKIGLNITIRAPVILIPQSTQSPNTLIAHLGDLTVRNSFEEAAIPEGVSVDRKPLVDHLKVELNALQVSRAMIVENQAYGARCLIVEPVSLHLDIKRALQPTIKQVLLFDITARLENIKINLGEQDLATMLAVTTQNLREGQTEEIAVVQESTVEGRVEAPVEVSLRVDDSQAMREDSGIDDDSSADEREERRVANRNWKETRVSFVMEGVDLELFTNEPRLDKGGSSGLQLRDPKHGLSQFMMHDVHMTASIYNDKTMEVKLTLQSISLEDIRKNSPLAIKKMFHKLNKTTVKKIELEDEEKIVKTKTISPMLEVTYKQLPNGDKTVDALVDGIRINVCTHYYLAVLHFFTSAMPKKKEDALIISPVTTPTDGTERLPTSPGPAQDNTGSLTVYAALKRPEIVLFAEPTSNESQVLVLKTEVVMDYNSRGGQDDIAANVKKLQIVSCVHSQPRETTNGVLSECNITFSRNSSPTTGNVTAINFTQVDLNISPTTVHIIKGVIDDFSALNQTPPETPLPDEIEVPENLWVPKSISKDDYVKSLMVQDDEDDVDLGIEVPEKQDILTLTIPKVKALVVLETGKDLLPMVQMETLVDARIKDVSTRMNLETELHLEMSYYNEKLDIWEPLIEPVMESENIYRPWEITVKMLKAQSRSISCASCAPPLGMETVDGLLQPIPLPNVYEPSDSETDTDTDEETEGDGDGHYSSSYFDSSEVGSPSDGEKPDEQLIKSDDDSDNEGVFDKIADFFGSMFSSDDESDVDDEELTVVPATAAVATSGDGDWEGDGEDEVDAPPCEDIGSTATFLVISSFDTMQVTLTPTAMGVIKDLADAFTKPPQLTLRHAEHKPAYKMVNSTGLKAKFLVHPVLQGIPVVDNASVGMRDVKPESEERGTLDRHDSWANNAPMESVVTEEPAPASEVDSMDWESEDTFSFLSHSLSGVGNTNTSTEAFVYDVHDTVVENISDRLASKNYMGIELEGFDPIKYASNKRSGKILYPLSPQKNGRTYSIVHQVDVSHGRKTVKVRAPLQIYNHLPIPVELYYKKLDLQILDGAAIPGEEDEEWTLLGSARPKAVFEIPLYVAYHCGIYLCPVGLGYFVCESAMKWPELSASDSRQRVFSCKAKQAKEPNFNIKVICEEVTFSRTPLRMPEGTPNFVLNLHPPVILHNYLPYSIVYSMETMPAATLGAGENLPMFTVRDDDSQKLQIQVYDYLSADWQGSFKISRQLKPYELITMDTNNHEDDRYKYLSLSVHTTHASSMDIFLYAPYWLVNKTELPVEFRGSRSRLVYENQTSSSPILFNFSSKKRKRAKIRVFESDWSDSFSLDTVGSSGVVTCKDKRHDRIYQFWLEIKMANLTLTKIVTLMPYFLVLNETSDSLSFMEEGLKAAVWVDIKPGECVPFWPGTTSMKLFVKNSDSNVSTQHFRVDKPHSTVLRMQHGTALNVDVTGGTEGPTTITFTPYMSGNAPVRIDNLCDNDLFIKIKQKNSNNVMLIQPNQSLLYTWDDPTVERTLWWNLYNRNKPSFPAMISKDDSGKVNVSFDSVRRSSLPGDGEYVEGEDGSVYSTDEEEDKDKVDGLIEHPLLNKTEKTTIYWASYLDGLQRVLLFTQDKSVIQLAKQANIQEQANMELFVSLEGIGVSLINSMYEAVAYAAITTAPAKWEVETRPDKWKVVNLQLAGILEDRKRHDQDGIVVEDAVEADFNAMTMTKPYAGKMRRTYYPAVWLQYRQSIHHSSIHAKIQKIQIDNQLQDAFFTTALYTAPIPKHVIKKSGNKPLLELSIMRRQVPEHQVDSIRYFKVLLQQTNVRIDKGFLLSVIDIFSSLEEPPEELQEGGSTVTGEMVQLRQDLGRVNETLKQTTAYIVAEQPQKSYFEYLHLSPVKIGISFSLSGTPHVSSTEDRTFKSDVIGFFINSIGATITDIRDVELKLAYFERTNVLMTREQLLSEVRGHYTSQGIKQAYVLLLGLDVLGNPYGLFKDLSEGIGDLFYEPYMGAVQGPGEFAEGLARGVQSLLGHTIGGTAGALARITGAAGKALASLSFDEEFKKRRNRRMQRHPDSLPESLLLAGKGFVLGIVMGISGVVVKPITGAQEEGIKGFLKGIGKGIMGLITRPTGGIIDMVSMTFDAIRRAADMGEHTVVRLRTPRFINPHVGVKPYSLYLANGATLLYNLAKGAFRETDIYFAHASLKSDQKDNPDVIILTDRQVLLLEKCRLWSGWDTEEKYPYEYLTEIPTVEGNKIILKIKEPDSSEVEVKEIYTDDLGVLNWLHSKLEKVILLHKEETLTFGVD
ncbi:intermembrane lipid transfer protein VPS13A-like isoform X2 [Ptychodera flava]|uniref:intermembrane lipid transfer protein VPS13A-like isoform X2 n=1 Tax=Ptychodera flava TaxID=63121 RepID=UPI00396AAF5B